MLTNFTHRRAASHPAPVEATRARSQTSMRWLALFLLPVVTLTVLTMAHPLPAAAQSGKFVVLDPGHGGSDAGAPSAATRTLCKVPADIVEKSRTLDISRRVRDILQSKGIRVEMTRDSDATVSLNDRVNFINSRNPNLAVSIHANSAEKVCGSGVEAFYSTQNPKSADSKALAQEMATNINKRLGLTLRRNNGIDVADYALTANPKVPAALVEMAFIGNEREAVMLRDRAGDFAVAIADAIQARLGVTPARSDVLVDDRSGGFSRGGRYWWEASLGYSGHMFWTYVNGTTTDSWGEWRANLAGGRYEVYVFVPRDNATSRSARYQVSHSGGTATVTVNQNNYYDAWVSIGAYSFAAGDAKRVRLTDASGENPSTKYKLGFDAVKFVPR